MDVGDATGERVKQGKVGSTSTRPGQEERRMKSTEIHTNEVFVRELRRVVDVIHAEHELRVRLAVCSAAHAHETTNNQCPAGRIKVGITGLRKPHQ